MKQPSIFTYKMVDPFDIDELIEIRNFEVTRVLKAKTGEVINSIFHCSLLGLNNLFASLLCPDF